MIVFLNNSFDLTLFSRGAFDSSSKNIRWYGLCFGWRSCRSISWCRFCCSTIQTHRVGQSSFSSFYLSVFMPFIKIQQVLGISFTYWAMMYLNNRKRTCITPLRELLQLLKMLLLIQPRQFSGKCPFHQVIPASSFYSMSCFSREAYREASTFVFYKHFFSTCCWESKFFLLVGFLRYLKILRLIKL